MVSQEIDVLVPKLIVSACKYIEDNVEIEGIYRLSGSAARQKVSIGFYIFSPFLKPFCPGHEEGDGLSRH